MQNYTHSFNSNLSLSLLNDNSSAFLMMKEDLKKTTMTFIKSNKKSLVKEKT